MPRHVLLPVSCINIICHRFCLSPAFKRMWRASHRGNSRLEGAGRQCRPGFNWLHAPAVIDRQPHGQRNSVMKSSWALNTDCSCRDEWWLAGQMYKGCCPHPTQSAYGQNPYPPLTQPGRVQKPHPLHAQSVQCRMPRPPSGQSAHGHLGVIFLSFHLPLPEIVHSFLFI